MDRIDVGYHSRRWWIGMHVKSWALAIVVAGLASIGVHAEGKQIPKPSPGLMPNPAASKTQLEASCAKCQGGN